MLLKLARARNTTDELSPIHMITYHSFSVKATEAHQMVSIFMFIS